MRLIGSRGNRRGVTLAELLVVLVLLGIIGSALTNLLGRQQRFYRGTGDIIELRTQLRQAASVVGNDLRNISSSGGDIVGTLSDSALDFHYTIGNAVVCSKAGATMVIPPTSLASGAALTTWLTKPTTGDTAYIFNEGADSTTSNDDTWSVYQVASTFTDNVNGCASPYAQPAGADAGKTAYTVTLDRNLDANIRAGAPVRFVRRAHYSLYQSSTDGLWYLGYCSLACSTSTNPISAVAGPFNAYAAVGAGTSGMRITYYDSTGTSTSTNASVSRINIVLRGQTRSYVNVKGLTTGYYTDSVRFDVAIRNRS